MGRGRQAGEGVADLCGPAWFIKYLGVTCCWRFWRRGSADITQHRYTAGAVGGMAGVGGGRTTGGVFSAGRGGTAGTFLRRARF